MARDNWSDNDLREMCAFPCSPNKLEQLKNQFQHVVNSTRRMDQVMVVRDLLDLLRKRDELSSKHLNETAAIINYTTSNLASALVAPVNPPAHTTSKSAGLVQAYEYICDRMGIHWTDFARALKLPENKIDNLAKIKNHEDRVMMILNYHEKHGDPNRWRQTLLAALVDARRKDISQKVEEVFDRYQIIHLNQCC